MKSNLIIPAAATLLLLTVTLTANAEVCYDPNSDSYFYCNESYYYPAPATGFIYENGYEDGQNFHGGYYQNGRYYHGNNNGYNNGNHNNGNGNHGNGNHGNGGNHGGGHGGHR